MKYPNKPIGLLKFETPFVNHFRQIFKEGRICHYQYWQPISRYFSEKDLPRPVFDYKQKMWEYIQHRVLYNLDRDWDRSPIYVELRPYFVEIRHRLRDN